MQHDFSSQCRVLDSRVTDADTCSRTGLLENLEHADSAESQETCRNTSDADLARTHRTDVFSRSALQHLLQKVHFDHLKQYLMMGQLFYKINSFCIIRPLQW